MQVIPILKILDLKLKKKKIYVAILFRRVLKSISLAEVRPLNLKGHLHENIGVFVFISNFSFFLK